jgi:senataxin
VKRIKISSFQEIVPTRDYDQVCEHLDGGNILVGSFRVSYNFFELSPGEVYHYDPNCPVLSRKNAHLNHAVMFVGYGGPSREVVTKDATNLAAKQATNLKEEESDIPHLVYQNSYGRLFGFGGGFGRVGVTSIKNLALVTI